MSDLGKRVAEKFPEQLKPKEFFSAVNLGFQEQIITFLLRAYGGLLAVTVSVIYLQGFHFKGFNLESGFLNWLGAATIGEIVGVLTLTIRLVFRRN